MEYTLEQIAGIKNALPFLNALDDDQLKKQWLKNQQPKKR